MSRKLLSVLLVAAIGFAHADEPDKLVGADDARPGEFPYAASLRVYGSHFCGGAIVGERKIITAAHCVEYMKENNLRDLTVVTGTNYLNRGGQVHRVSHVESHPQYGGKGQSNAWYNDVGIVTLASPIVFNAAQNKINLPTSAPPTSGKAVVSAWGQMGANLGLSSSLQKLYLDIIGYDKCKSVFGGDTIGHNMICTFNGKGTGTCSGDSGSPLAYGNEIIGVVSGGIPCALGYPDVFTNLYSTLPFITKAMAS